MLPISSEARPKLSGRARLAQDKVTGKPIVLYPEGVLILNPTGYAIVTLCTGRETLEEIVTKLAAQYRVSPEELRPDVIEYLNRLRSRNLLEISSEKL